MKPQTIELIKSMFLDSIKQLNELSFTTSNQSKEKKELITIIKSFVDCENDFLEHVELLKEKK